MFLLAPVLSAQDMAFDSSVPSEILHHYALNGRMGGLRFKGKPVAKGARVVVMGTLLHRDYDVVGDYIDLKGIPTIGHVYGAVRCYVPRSELSKLQRSEYVYHSAIPPRRSPPEVAVEGTVLGLDDNRNLVLTNGRLVGWLTALLPQQNKREAIYGYLLMRGRSQRWILMRSGSYPTAPIYAFVDEPTGKAINDASVAADYKTVCMTLVGIHGDEADSAKWLEGLAPQFSNDTVTKSKESLRQGKIVVIHHATLSGKVTPCAIK